MDEKQLQALANERAKNLKTPEDLSQFNRLLKKLSVEAALNAEMTHHLGYEKNQTRITGMDVSASFKPSFASLSCFRY